MTTRLAPPLYNPVCIVLRQMAQVMCRICDSEDVRKARRVYDYGCGTMPYRSLFRSSSQNYMGFDIASNPLADGHLDRDFRMPVPDCSAELVLSTQVLEHVPSPSEYLRECSRVLVDDGQMILSTHGFFNYHGCPEDYRRWTLYGLVHEIEAEGFEVVQRWSLLTGWACALQLLQHQITRRLPRWGKGMVFIIFQCFMALFAGRPRAEAPISVDACVFLLVARKRTSA